ncbi:MAG: S24 family peptidase [Gemmatimonadaceae bacterium]
MTDCDERPLRPVPRPEREERGEPVRHVEVFGPVPPSEELSPEARAQVEFETELLAQLVGSHLARRPDPAAWRDERFLEWKMRQLAERPEARRDATWSDEELLEFGRRMLARASAKRLAVRQMSGAPDGRLPSVVALPSQAFEYAEQTGSMPYVDLAAAAGAGRDMWDEPVERWVELPPGVPRGRYLALKVDGNSMAPLMHTGDTVLVRIGAKVRRETVIVARHPEDGYVCKVVHRIRGSTVELRSLDPERPIITIPRDDRLIVGTVVAVWCHHNQEAAAP